MSAKAWVLLSLLVVGVALGVALAYAPASVADALVAKASLGRVRIAQAQGTVWAGQGQLVLIDPLEQTRLNEASLNSPTRQLPVLAGMTLPGNYRWKLAFWPLLKGGLDVQVLGDGMPGPLNITGSWQRVVGSAGSMRWPPMTFDRMGSPWNTIQPHGGLELRWEPFVIQSGRYVGKSQIQFSDMASALSPVRPLGDYAVDIDGNEQQTSLTMKTLRGALQLEGSGFWSAQAGLKFTAYAKAQSDEARLTPLLSLLGSREGDRILIKIGK